MYVLHFFMRMQFGLEVRAQVNLKLMYLLALIMRMQVSDVHKVIYKYYTTCGSQQLVYYIQLYYYYYYYYYY